MDTISNTLSALLAADSGNLTLMQGALAVLVAYLGGVVSSLTPCVYPMLPITVSVVGGMKTQERSWRDMMLRSGAYIFGMSIIYSFLGVAAGLTGRVFGSFTNSSGWYLGLGIITSVAALMMLDVIHIDPVHLLEKTKALLGFKRHAGHHGHRGHHKSHEREMTLLGAFALGASSGFIAAPCTTPVLTTILAYIARSQSVVLGLTLMSAFSLGLGTLLLVLAVFTSAVKFMPRSGGWMTLVKRLSGIALLAFGEYLIFRAGKSGGV